MNEPARPAARPDPHFALRIDAHRTDHPARGTWGDVASRFEVTVEGDYVAQLDARGPVSPAFHAALVDEACANLAQAIKRRYGLTG